MKPTSPALARTTDPHSSLRGADYIENSGKLAAQCQAVLDALKTHPMHTARELSVATGIDYYTIARRLPELKRRNLAQVRGERVCTQSRTNIAVQVWEAT